MRYDELPENPKPGTVLRCPSDGCHTEQPAERPDWDEGSRNWQNDVLCPNCAELLELVEPEAQS